MDRGLLLWLTCCSIVIGTVVCEQDRFFDQESEWPLSDIYDGYPDMEETAKRSNLGVSSVLGHTLRIRKRAPRDHLSHALRIRSSSGGPSRSIGYALRIKKDELENPDLPDKRSSSLRLNPYTRRGASEILRHALRVKKFDSGPDEERYLHGLTASPWWEKRKASLTHVLRI